MTDMPRMWTEKMMTTEEALELLKIARGALVEVYYDEGRWSHPEPMAVSKAIDDLLRYPFPSPESTGAP